MSLPQHSHASAEPEPEDGPPSSAIQYSQDDGARMKRSRENESPPKSSGIEVISLLSSDEEEEGEIRESKTVKKPRWTERQPERHSPSRVIPSRRGQDPNSTVINPYSPYSPYMSYAPPSLQTGVSFNLSNVSVGDDGMGGMIKKEPGFGICLDPEPNHGAYGFHTPPSLLPPSSIPPSSNPEPLRELNGETENPSPGPIKEPSLCPEQAELVDLILSGKNVFYTGSAGCGKSTVLKAFTKRFREQCKRVDIIAPTGISALGVGGSTTFVYAGWSVSSFRKPLDELRRAAHGKHVRKRLKDTDVLVIDEISMVENFHFERLNAVMQEARNSKKPFGGVQLVVTGDFHQLPPVKPFSYCLQCGEELAKSQSEEHYTCRKHGIFHDEDKWAFRSKAWEKCKFVYFHLKTIHRQNDETFIKILQKCRIGDPLSIEDTDILMNHPCRIGNATKLYARREEVRQENKKRFDKLLSEKFSFPCMDEFRMLQDNPQHLRHTIRLPDGSLSSLKDHRFETMIEFKKGMLVVLLVNLDLGRKLCNGSQGIICGYEDVDPTKLPKAVKKNNELAAMPLNPIHGDYAEMREWAIRTFMEREVVTKKVWPIVKFHNGETRTIYADCSVHVVGSQAPYCLLSRTQIPLAPAWAMSIHKSQSLTLDRVIVDLTRAWEEGQVYVALSRATSLMGLKIEGDPKGLSVGMGGNPEVKKFHRDKFGL